MFTTVRQLSLSQAIPIEPAFSYPTFKISHSVKWPNDGQQVAQDDRLETGGMDPLGHEEVLRGPSVLIDAIIAQHRSCLSAVTFELAVNQPLC
jgi:hypothetical protein